MTAQIELTDLLAGFAAVRDEAAAPDGAVRLPGIAAQVRRRRVVRTVAASGLAAAAVLGIAAGVYGLTRPDPTPPVQTPSPTVTRTPSPTPTEEPTQEPTEEPPRALGDVTVHPLLPAAQPLMEGVLEETTPAWSMVTYFDQGVVDGEAEDHPAVLYLVGPDGTLVEVPTPLPMLGPCGWCGDEGEGRSSVLRQWLPGTSLAITTTESGFTDVHRVVDLLTGEVLQSAESTQEDVLNASFVKDGTSDVLLVRSSSPHDGGGIRSLERRRADGTVVASYTPDPADRIEGLVIDQAGRRAMLQGPEELLVLDLATLTEGATIPPIVFDDCQEDYSSDDPEGRPTVQRWLDADTLLLTCATGEPTSSGTSPEHLWLLDTDGTVHDLGGNHPAAYGWAAVEGRLLVSDGLAWFEVLPDGTRVALPLDASVSPTRVVDGRAVYVDNVGYSGVEGVPEPTGALVWADLSTGARGVLLDVVDPGSRIDAAT